MNFQPHRGILIPKHKEIIRDAGSLAYQVSGRFRIVARSARYKGERVLADFDNLILDAGLVRITGALGLGNTKYVQLGTGTTAPAAAQTALTAYSSTIGTQFADVHSYVPGPPPYNQIVHQMRGTVGGNTGTFSEIGFGWASVGSLFSRALILDSGGSPTTITVLSDEQLDVFYTFRWYYPTVDTTGTVTIAGTTHNWTARAAGITYQYSSLYLLTYGLVGYRSGNGDRIYQAGTALGAITGVPSSGSVGTSSGVNHVYTAPNLYADTITTFPLTSTPTGGVGAFLVALQSMSGAQYGIQVAFTPAIPKLSTQILTLTTRASIARYP